jgi:hypothetical protein
MLQLQLQLHDSEVAERISNDGMNGEAVGVDAGVRHGCPEGTFRRPSDAP